jgi:hypothetical protein
MVEATKQAAKPVEKPPEPPVRPVEKDSGLLAAAKARAPHLTAEFVAEHGLTDQDVQDIADGLVPPPPYIGPVPVVDLHRTPGGWQITPKGVSPEDVGKGAVSR